MSFMPYAGTYTGHYEPVAEVSELLDEYERKTGHSIPIHGQSIISLAGEL